MISKQLTHSYLPRFWAYALIRACCSMHLCMFTTLTHLHIEMPFKIHANHAPNLTNTLTIHETMYRSRMAVCQQAMHHCFDISM